MRSTSGSGQGAGQWGVRGAGAICQSPSVQSVHSSTVRSEVPWRSIAQSESREKSRTTSTGAMMIGPAGEAIGPRARRPAVVPLPFRHSACLGASVVRYRIGQRTVEARR
jgi:hypothetical protein